MRSRPRLRSVDATIAAAEKSGGWSHASYPALVASTASWRTPANALPISRGKCVEQINMLERQRRDVETALAELWQIYTEMFTSSDAPPRIRAAGSRKG